MRSLGIFAVSWPIAAVLCLGGPEISAAQGTTNPAATMPTAAGNPAQSSSPGAPPLKLTLQDALERARKNSAPFQAALTDSALAGKIDFRRAPRCFPVSPTSIKRGTPKPGRTVSFLLPTTRCTNTSARETYMSRWTLRACRAFVAPPRLRPSPRRERKSPRAASW